MPTTTYRVLGQLNPSANVETTVYTVPAATQTVVSTIAVCNLANVATTFSLAVKVANAAVAKDRKITRLNSSHTDISRMPSSA